MEHGSWLTGSLVYLAAAVLAVPLAKALGLGSIIGYLAAGIVIAGEAGATINDFFAGTGLSKGNPILCCTPGLAVELRRITGIA